MKGKMKISNELKRKDNNNFTNSSGKRSENIALHLKSIRKQKGYSRSELAEKVNLSTSTIAKYEEGCRIPSLETLLQLTKTLHTSLDNLFL